MPGFFDPSHLKSHNVSGCRSSYVSSGCAIAGMQNIKRKSFSGEAIVRMLARMKDRSNGLGGGFAGYGIYPEHAKHYAFHVMFAHEQARRETEAYLVKLFDLAREENIPVRPEAAVSPSPILRRYFLTPLESKLVAHDEDSFVVEAVMRVNKTIEGAYVASCGKNMGVFKGVGYPEDVAEFYRLEEYQGHIWTGHGRFPTNTAAWWGGAHPFSILNWSVVHNGEISSYGTNKRFLENYGYHLAVQTDTEVIVYALDLLLRRHNLSLENASQVLAAPFWHHIERLQGKEKELALHLRLIYGSALLQGPFSIIVADGAMMWGLVDRVKLRPLVAALEGDFFSLATEESALKEVMDTGGMVWAPRAGEPVLPGGGSLCRS